MQHPTIVRIKNVLRLLQHEISAHLLNSVIAVTLGMVFVWALPESIVGHQCHCHSHGTSWWSSITSIAPFHVMHFSHTFFASMTATLTAMRFSNKNIWKSILVGALVPPFFCALSDILVPYWGGQMAGIEMQLHLCIFKNTLPVIILIICGVSLGLLGSLASGSVATPIRLAASSHFLHDFVSAAASLTYLVSFGYFAWVDNLIYIFCLMLAAVIVPCMLSDFIMPIIICAPKNLPAGDHEKCCAYSLYNQNSQKGQ